MNKKSTNPMVSNRQKKKRLVMRTFAMLFFMALFTQIAQAQNVYMHSGTQTVPAVGSINFYDSGGPNSSDGSYFWEKFYSTNENSLLTFKNGSNPIKVTFNTFQAWDDTGWPDYTLQDLGNDWGVRLNDDHLYIYDGENEANLITHLTGNIKGSFSVMANGPISFRFVSNGQYQEEGWYATVTSESAYVPQAPIIAKDNCDDEVVLFSTAHNATIYYTTDGSNPTTSSTKYTDPFSINLDANNASVTVKAISVVDGQGNSAVASKTFTHADQVPNPGVPTISIDGNMVHITPADVPAGLNETYNVRYTVDGSEPSANNGTEITKPWAAFEWHTPNTTFKAVTVAVSCSDKVSSVVSESFGNVTVPTPVITFNADGTATISCSLTGASIFYTLDGTTPTTSSGDFGTTPVTTVALTPGTTVKAIAHYESTGYVTSSIASEIYVPSGGSTANGSVVLLDDREDHSWSYYSDADQPIHSLNPADVKITYFGYGNNTMTTTNTAATGLVNADFNANVTSEQVAVNVGEPENQFIYLKTLEKDGDNYPYTMIPNPFQVRPKYDEGDKETRDEEATIGTGTSTTGYAPLYGNYKNSYDQMIYTAQQMQAAGVTGSCTINKIGFNSSETNSRTRTVNLYMGHTTKSTFNSSTDFVSINDLTLVYSGTWNISSGWNEFPLTSAFAYDGTSNVVVAMYSTASNYASSNFYYTQSSSYPVIYARSDNYAPNPSTYEGNWSNYDGSTATSNQLPNFRFSYTSGGSGSSSDYRGFYAWRIKSLSPGLTVSGKNVGDIVNADEEIKFVTSKEEGNEVEFEALWAKAWVTNSTNTSSLNANASYERNFMVLGTNPGTSSITTQWPTSTSTTYTDGSNLPIYQYSDSYLYSLTQQIYTPAQVGEAGRITQLAFNVRTSQNRSRTLQIYITKTSLNAVPTTTNSSNETVYRTIPIDVDNDLVFTGTYNFSSTGWNTITLTTPFEYDGASNIVVSVFDNTNRTHSLSFYTYSSGGSKSCYFSYSSTPDLSQYYYYVDGVSTYNNQIRFVKTNSEVSALNVPLTMTTYNPDGTGGSSTVTLSNSIHAAADIKFENIKMNAIPVLSANGHNLIVGRGVTPSTSGGVCASYVKGLNANATSPNYKIRLESGTYTTVSMVDGYYGNESSLTISGTPKVSLVLGNDYDRATEKYTDGSMTISNNLNVTEGVAVGRSLTIGSSSMIGEETFKTWVKSGKICSSFSMENFNADFTKVLYMSSHGRDTYAGYRKLFIEGGEISAVSGGMDACYTSTTTNSHTKTLTVRMTNGHIRSAIYGGAAQVPSGGDKEIIVTGGVVTGWIGAGCNGTTDDEGQTYGEGFVYFGGDAISGGDGSSNLTNGVQGGVIFGAGAGRATSTTTGEMTFGTNVVIADECNVEHNVYGGGNYGYAVDHSNVYVLGGTIQGNVFGGANQKQGPVVNITMENGTVSGNIYGGSNALGTISGLATINVSGGTVTNVFGGGKGSNTDMAAGTKVTISNGTINNNVYGGGEEGTVSSGGTEVNVSGGTMKDVYGAGKGATNQTALVSGQTKVNISGGTLANVYGGGQNGNVVEAGGYAPGESDTYDFDDSSLSGWTNIDADGDGFVWVLGSAVGGVYLVDGATLANYGHNTSADMVVSGSYRNISGGGTALEPDNYLVSPQIALGGSISFWACAQHDSYPSEHFGVAVSTSGNINASDFTTIQEWTMTAKSSHIELNPKQTRGGNRDQGTWYQYTVNLSAYAGQTGYVAIRHFDVTDQFILNVDDIVITGPDVPLPSELPASIVSVSGGAISGDVFGGGKMGTTTGAVTTNVSGGNIRGNVFGGAEGEQQKVFVTGLRTVNMTGGHVYGNVYGGSRNANDGNSLSLAHSSFASSTETGTISVTNISGGTIDQNVYAAGYYGNTFGSVYAFIGKNAIENAPYKRPNSNVEYKVSNLNILGTVWAGGDWGTFSGTFGAPTISGNSNIYVDGLDYETTTTQTSNAQYMNIGGSILGCGTSCDAGKAERTIMVRNYGTDNATGSKDEPFVNATRTLYSIQRAKVLIIDNSHLNFSGQGMINSLSATEKYAIYEIANTGNTLNTEDLNYGVRLVNGSSLFLNAPVSQISNFISASCTDVYTADLTTDYTPLIPTTLGSAGGSTDNKVRVNGGNYVEVKYGNKFCMLKGYAHMMVSTDETDATCAYARPRWETNAPFAINNNSYDNRDDGGWVSYTESKNKFALDGSNGTGITGVQMAYENHTHAKNGEDYFRIWRDGSIEHYREGVFDAHATGTDTYKTVDVTITLPPLRDRSYVYRFETIGDGTNTSIDFGADVMAYDAARANGTGNDWISYTTSQQSGQAQSAVQSLLNNGILANPDVNYGLVVMPTTGLGLTGGTYLISQNSDNNLAATTTQFTNNDFTKDDQITFRLTYYDKLSSNMTWDPMTIVLVQVDPNDPSVILDRVTISLAVNTSTTITQEFHTTLYAVMQGKATNAETYTAKVTLPNFTVVSGQESTFTVNSVSFAPYGIPNGSATPTETGNLITRGGTYTRTDFAVTYGAGNNYDNTNGWASNTGQGHDANDTSNDELGKTGGRNEFSIDFHLHYNGHESLTTTDTLGVLTYNITFDYFVDENNVTQMNQPMTIKVYVIRRGQGTRFYLDGINGSNQYDGKHPDQAALSLSTIFNRLGFMAGDEIYIVNKVTIDKQTSWNGSAYDNVLIYRYDGGHELATSAGIIGNTDNTAYLDTLLYVKHNLVMTGITLDGHYNNGENQIQAGVDNDNNPVYVPFTPVTAESPMIAIANGAKVELNEGAVLRQNNNNTSDGGAVYVAEGGTLMMNADAAITNNKTAGNGGGVYMAGTLNVSDDIQIYDNKKGTVQNNVYLTADKVVTIGTGSTTDAYGALSANAKIGVTKTTTSEFTEVVHVDSENDVAWLDIPYDMHPNTVIFHDANKYQLERYTDITYLYWVGTWVTTVTWNPYFESRDAAGYTDYMTAAQLKDIHTEEQLAWVISMANGENNCTPQSNMQVEITKDLDMNASIWVPIGTTAHPFDGTFEGNGHVVEGIHSSLVHNNMGVFGTANGTIQNAIFKVEFNANSTNMGTVAGTMTGGTISNIEAAGTLTGGSLTENMGGLVGLTQTGSEIHSSFSVNTMTGVATTVVGGLVGTNGGDLINSYANTAMSVSEHIGGLVGDNNGRVENCYVVVGVKNFPLFANTNSSTGIITYCYADKAGTYIDTDNNATAQPTKSGNYGAVLGYKDYGYMYDDNKVTASGNNYVLAEHAYDANHIVKWDGLLSVLNQWVGDHSGYTSWFRPITQNINGDLPVLGFPKNNSMATLNSDKKFLEYSSDLDQLLEDYSGQTASIFLYGNAANVTKTPGTNTMVYINENAALIQAGSSDFKAVVGVTFDNNYRKATTWNEIIGLQTLTYDWHFLSSPLQAAPLGISYTDEEQHNWWVTGDDTQVDQVVGSYFPDHIELAKKADGTTPVGWDIYSFFEPQYHWINLKRNSASHFHYDMNDENIHENIVYTNETTFEPGKGYMMAVETDSYLANSGMLNNKDFTVNLTYQSPEEDEKGCNFLGNPYHAYFDLDAFFNNTTNAGNGISSAWVYIAESDDYVPYAKGASSNPLLPSGALHPFQGFFVKVTGDCTAQFTKSMATTEQDNSYFRGSHENYPLVNLFAYNEAGQRDFVVVEFNRPEKGGATKMTAQRRAPFTLTAQDGQDEYTILFNDQNTKRVPIRFATTEDGTYTMQWETYHGTFNKLLLIDNITGTTCDMTTNDHYTFEGRATDFANRFYLVVNATDVDEFDADGDYNNFAYFNGSEWIVNGQGQLDLIDMTGRVLHSEYLAGESNRVSFGNVAAGVYVIRFGNKAQKIVIK